MTTLILTAAAGVTDVHIAKAIAAVGGAATRLGARSVRIDGVSGSVQIDGVDANILPNGPKAAKLLIADMDSTMIPVECIDELADFAGVKDRVADITERAMRGELDFEEAINERVGLLTGLPESALQQCYEERIALNPGAKTLVETMNARGAMTALVSGGFTFFTSRVAAVAGFQMNRANTLLFENGALTGKVGLPILGREAKLEALNELCAVGGYGAEDAIAVGDGANDLAMVEAAGLGVAYKAKPALVQKSEAQLDHSDLTALLALQGIPEADYAG